MKNKESRISKRLSDFILSEKERCREQVNQAKEPVQHDNLTKNSIAAIGKRVVDFELNHRTGRHLDESLKKTAKETQDDLLHDINNEISHNTVDKIPEGCNLEDLNIKNAKIPNSNKYKMSEFLTPVVKIKHSEFDNQISLYENKMSVEDIQRILDDKEIKNKKYVLQSLNLRFIPKSIKKQYQDILYGTKKQQKHIVETKQVLQAAPQGLIYDVYPAVKINNDNIADDFEYNDEEEYDPESTNAYYSMIDNRKDYKHWRELGNTTHGNFLLPGSGVSYDGCGAYSSIGCIGSGHWKNRNGAAGDILSMPDTISNEIHKKSGKGKLKIIPHMCNRLSCNVCYKSAISNAANAAADRISAGVYLKDTSGSGMKRRIPLHGVLSVSKRSKTVIQYYRKYKGFESTCIGQLRGAKIKVCNTPYDELRDPKVVKKEINKIMKILRRAGIEGACVIFHPFRFSKGLRIPRWSPHFHLIYLGYTDKNDIKEFEENSSFIFHQVKRKKGKNTLSTKSDISRLIRYLLSHAGIAKGHHTVKWFGDLHTNAFKTENILSKMNTYNNQPLATVKAVRDVLDMSRKIHRVEVQYMRDGDPAVNLHDSDFNNLVHSKSLVFSFDSFAEYVEKKTINDLDFEKEFDKNVRLSYGHNIDNPAISKSATLSEKDIRSINVGFYVLSLRYYYLDKNHLEKCGYVIVVFDPDRSCLCPDCHALLRLMIPINEIIPPDMIAEHVKSKHKDTVHTVDAEDYRYVDNDDIAKGMPYCLSNGMVQRSTGIAVLSADYHSLDIHSRVKQYDEYLDSLARYAMRQVKQQLRLSGYGDKNPRQNYRLRFHIMRGYIMGLQDRTVISNAWSNSLWSALSLIYTNIDQVPKIKTKTKSQRLDSF